MILEAGASERDAILGAMESIALATGPDGISAADRRTIDSAAEIVFGAGVPEPGSLEPRTPEQLAAAVGDGEDARMAVRMLAVMALVDGRIEPAKISLLREYARALAVSEEYLQVLAEAAADEVAAAAACMIRKNAESFPHLDTAGIAQDAIAPFLPYRDGHGDPGLEARYESLGELPRESFGWAFWDHFKRNSFAFPGNESGLAEGFTTPHDSSHVISGYSTSQQGELCVSTFIGAMHPDHPMAAEVLPVLFSWHLGIKLNEIARSSTGAFDPRKFWTAWDRGKAASVDLVAADWDFWAATEVPLADLRADYDVPAVDEALLA